ncbi:TetR/AcrR family transcriptional regulator [Kribbella turkmenica]|uniref:TetR/AcrR family transcriptional regulator n=1 Tax=Kribbella turkmenica TaxID=2530375 RepID=A0A4R4XCU4_9ACTN|nr:TetR/AcrR family transcriptional regulator [Kribbella turkmenica]TDD28558.1 TetR/AcrR family transcriptional regulator [Kribbella turkmenica]
MPKVTEEHRAARRAQIVAAARRCVIEQGFHKTTMAEVIRESGLSAGAVYGYFKSKEQIVEAIAEEALSTVDELFGKLLASEEPLSPLAALEAALNHVVSIAERPGGDVTRVAIQAWSEALRNPAIMTIAQGKYAQVRGRFEDVARRGQADGTVDPSVDPRHIAQALFGIVPGFLLQRLIMGDVAPGTYTAGLRALLRS